jgi:biofilm protein TabA
MIIASLEALFNQIPASPLLERALRYLQENRERNLPDGRYEIDGSRLFALVQSYETLPNGPDTEYEAHQNYIDVQYIVSGVEGMGWAPLECMQVRSSYNPEKDVVLGECQPELTTLTRVNAGQAVIFFPADAHAPKLAVTAPVAVKKIVVKVAVSERGI